MQLAESVKWILVISGAGRSELAQSFRGSRWEDDWFNHANPIEDDYPDSGYAVSLDIEDLETLVLALKCVGHLKPDFGINLLCQGQFETFSVDSTLSTKRGPYSETSCVFRRSGKSTELESIKKLAEAEKALGELRNLLAVNGAC